MKFICMTHKFEGKKTCDLLMVSVIFNFILYVYIFIYFVMYIIRTQCDP